MKKKKVIIGIGILLLVIVVAVVLISTNRRSAPPFDVEATNLNKYVYGSVPDLNVSLGDNGLYYSKGSLLRYYDMEKKQDYVLCGKANCTHLSETCCAFFPEGLYGDQPLGVAQIGTYVYCFHQDTEGVRLYELDLTDWSRDVVAFFPSKRNVATDQPDEFYPTWVNAITDAEYCDGYAWTELHLTQQGENAKSYTQLIGINLETGEVIRLNDSYDESEYVFDCICHGFVYYSRMDYTEEMISFEEFYEQYGDEPATIDGMFFENWDDYWYWFVNTIPREDQTYQYDVKNHTSTLFWSGFDVMTEYSQLPPVQVLGNYQGDTLWCEYLPDEEPGDEFFDIFHRRHYLRDAETGTDQLILETKDGATLAIAQGYHPSSILSDGTFLYLEYTGEETMDIYLFDLNTMESRFLFTDDRRGTFRIFGEYNGGFFGKHKDHQDDMRFYWISKEDFYAGNLDAAIMYQL